MNQPYQAPPDASKKSLSVGVIVAIVVGGLLLVGVVGVGILATLAMYGTKKYLASAKTAEAKNTVGAISRAAMAAYEREGVGGHALCASRGPAAAGHAPVPQDFHLVQGKKYTPSTAPGVDYDTGTPAGGWRCLKFAMTQPSYYQYHYVAGGPWVTKNGDAAGPNGFEAAAKGDIDGNGTPSFFSRTGKVEGAEVKLETNLYVENELE
ncbi:MAG TPA: hypothetical protein VGM56_17665 [Byssovorax sp.]|jgi:type IV pilus assembly protein PilA